MTIIECASGVPPNREVILKNRLKPVNKCHAGDCEIRLQSPNNLNEECKSLLKRLTRCHPQCCCRTVKVSEETMRCQFMKDFDSSQASDISRFIRLTIQKFEENEVWSGLIYPTPAKK
jgi:hypothetical protein